MRRILILTLLILPCIYAAAQQYPVQVTPQLLPPYTLQVSEYYSPGAAGAKLNLLLLLRDFNKPTLQVRLRMSIESQSVSIRTREDAVFDPITLESGVPRYLDPGELEHYFNSNKLQFSGITQQQYEQTGKLPEGLYTFCFEVIEVGTNLVVSNKGCSMAWMTLNEPPLLNIPRKAESLIPTDPQNILFQWTPRHMSSPTASYNTEYTFYIVEIQDDAIAPEAAFLSNPILDSATVTTTFFRYDQLSEPLIPTKKYAWRVQAKAKQGLQDLALFRNNGFSETFWFTYQSNCALPSGIDVNPQGQVVGISWAANPDHLDYKVEYREKNNPNAVWFDLGNTRPYVSLTDLKFSTTYEFRVGAACEYGKFVFSPLDEFNTNDSLSSTVAACGIDPNLVATTAPLLQEMNPGDTIKAGDFDVIATVVNGQGGNFSGEGYVAVSWLANMKIGVRFANIEVATDKKLKSGVIETTYDATEGGIADVDEFISTVAGIINELADLFNISIDKDRKEIKELIEKIKDEIREQMPDSLFTEFENTLNTLDSAKEQYDHLKEIFENSTDPAEREAAKNGMEQAEEKFKDAQEKLKELDEEKEKIVSDIVEILIDATGRLRTEQYPDATIQQLKTVRDQKRTAFNDYLAQTKQGLQGYQQVPVNETVEELGSVVNVITLAEDSIDLPGHPAHEFKKAEFEYNTARVVKAFANNENKADNYKLILQYLKAGQEKYVAYVTQKLASGVTRETITVETKTILLNFVIRLLEGDVGK